MKATEKLIEISDGVYFPNVEAIYFEEKSKSVIVDGETYTKYHREQCCFNSENEFLNKDNDRYWELFTFDFSDFNHKNICVWDYLGFTNSINCYSLLDEICCKYNTPKNYNSRLYRLFNYVFYDFENPKIIIQKYKTIPDKTFIEYSPLEKTIFDKKKICNIEDGYRTDINDYQQEYLFDKNVIRLRHKTERYLIISIPIKHFLTLNIFEFDEYYKQQIKYHYMYNDCDYHNHNVAFNFPEFILKRKLTEIDKNKLISEILIKKTNYKQIKKNNHDTTKQ